MARNAAQKRYAEKQRLAGRCRECGGERAIDPETGKRFEKCAYHMWKGRTYAKRYYERTKNARIISAIKSQPADEGDSTR